MHLRVNMSGWLVRREDVRNARLNRVAEDEPSDSFSPLADALGGTIALVDSSSSIQTTYDPFGDTIISGAINGDEFEYCDRQYW